MLTARLGGSNRNSKKTMGIQPKSARETRKLPLARSIGGSSVLIEGQTRMAWQREVLSKLPSETSGTGGDIASEDLAPRATAGKLRKPALMNNPYTLTSNK
jgi:hypothetical protein